MSGFLNISFAFVNVNRILAIIHKSTIYAAQSVKYTVTNILYAPCISLIILGRANIFNIHKNKKTENCLVIIIMKE